MSQKLAERVQANDTWNLPLPAGVSSPLLLERQTASKIDFLHALLNPRLLPRFCPQNRDCNDYVQDTSEKQLNSTKICQIRQSDCIDGD